MSKLLVLEHPMLILSHLSRRTWQPGRLVLSQRAIIEGGCPVVKQWN